MHRYEFVGFRKNKGEIFYIDGVNISDKTWFNTGKCVTVKGNKNNYYIASEYYIKVRENQKLYFAVVNTNENKEAIYSRVNDGVN